MSLVTSPSVCCWCDWACVSAGGWRRPAGVEKRWHMGSGWSNEFYKCSRLRAGQRPIRLHPSIPVPVLDHEPHRHQPARLLWSCSALSSSADVRLTAALLTLRPLIGGSQRCLVILLIWLFLIKMIVFVFKITLHRGSPLLSKLSKQQSVWLALV